MYGGRGAAGVPGLPSPMSLAHVGCSGCHTVPTPVDREERELTGSSMVAVRAACEVCHGSGYGNMVDTWRRDIDASLSETQAVLKRVRRTLGPGPSPADQRIMETAERNIRFVRLSVPVHNYEYAKSILDKTVDDLEKIIAHSKQR
jgi:hypothetical protein